MRARAAAYFLHLTIPAFLALDFFRVWVKTGLGFVGMLILTASLAWLLVGNIAWIVARNRATFLQRALGPLISIYTLTATLIILECFLRAGGWGMYVRQYIWPPGLVLTAETDPDLMPGVKGPATFTVNDVGLRGSSFPSDPCVYRIIAVGGSTTQCLQLDDSKAWPHLLMENLNSRPKSRTVWVGNAGVGGSTCVHHLLVLRSIPVLSQVEALIFLVGINDMKATVSLRGGPSQEILESEAKLSFESDLDEGSPGSWAQRTQLWRIARHAIGRFRSQAEFRRYDSPKQLRLWREQRAQSSLTPLPALETGLREYSDRIRELCAECRRRSKRCIFVTQPVLYRRDPTPDEARLVYAGWVGEGGRTLGYVSIPDLAEAMETYNRVLIQVCRELNVECIDLAARLERSTATMFDDCHFNEAGAREVAKILAEYLLSQPPLR